MKITMTENQRDLLKDWALRAGWSLGIHEIVPSIAEDTVELQRLNMLNAAQAEAFNLKREE